MTIRSITTSNTLNKLHKNLYQQLGTFFKGKYFDKDLSDHYEKNFERIQY